MSSLVGLFLSWFATLVPVQTSLPSTQPAAGQSTLPRAFFGINVDLIYDFRPEEWGKLAESIKDVGAGSVRLPIRWLLIEPERGRWDFSRFDAAIAAIPKDVEILAILMSTPAWASGVDRAKAEGWFDAYPSKDLAAWGNYVEKTVAHYKGRIKHWEIWNEQNGVDFYRPRPDLKGYAELLKIAHEAAKRADPGCVVVLGGLQMNGIIANPWSPVKVENFLEDLYKAGARPCFDVCNIHPYVLPDEGAARMMAMTRDTLALMARYGDADKPLWITEVGCGINANDTAEDQRRLLLDTYRLTMSEPRIQRVFWFMLRDMEHDLLGPEASMGLLARPWVPKPAYRAFREIVRGPATRSGTISNHGDRTRVK